MTGWNDLACFFFQEACDSSVKIDGHLGCQAYSCAAIILVGSSYLVGT